MVRFAITPPPSQGSLAQPFAAQLAVARAHPRLVALMRVPHGYGVAVGATRGWFEVPVSRGLAGYGLARALRMLLDVLAGLSALHETRTERGQPFVHGELAPALMRVDERGVTRLIALAPWHWSAPGTLPAQGRWGHLAPERLLGDAIDQRADVFSAGVLLWEALAGRRLFENEPVDSIVMRLMGGKVILPPLPPELTWAVPLKSIAMCALSVDPEQRFANCAELIHAIEAVAGAQVATHDEVAAYFGAPDRATLPSLIEPPASVPTHNSSLSALVSPVQAAPAAPVQASVVEAAPRDSSAPELRPSRRPWAVIAALCVLAAIGVSVATLRNAEERASHVAAERGAPLLGQSTRAALPALSAPTAASAAPVDVTPSVAEAPRASAAPQVPAPSAEPAAAESAGKPSRSLKTPKAPATAPKLKVPPKPVRPRDKEAEQYGI